MQTTPVDGLPPLFPAAMIADLQGKDEQSAQFLINAEPGGNLTGQSARRLPNLASSNGNHDAGIHMLPEDAPDQIRVA